MAALLRVAGGAALIIDYGQDAPLKYSLQAVRNHEYWNVLDNPGEADITAHVDFSALRRAFEAMPPPSESDKKIIAHPLVRQRILLREMGLEGRLQQLLDACKDDEAKQEHIVSGAVRLIDDETDESMGVLFKCFCLAEEKIGVPLGFYKDE